MNVLNITFKGNYATRAGVTFRRGTNASVMVGSTVYNNVYGIITDKLSDTDMKSIANNIANIANIGKLVSVEMKKTQVKPHGRWFVAPTTIRTQVKDKYGIYNAVYSTDTGKRVGNLQRVLAPEVKPANIPALRTKKVIKRKESASAGSYNPKTDRPNNKTELSMKGFELV